MSSTNLSDSLATSLFRPVETSQAVDEVTKQIRALITNGDLKEGERLASEAQLSEAFNVSRPIVREALRGLRSLGLVVTRSGSGTYVASRLPSPQLHGHTVAELHEVRTLLEVPGAGYAAERASEQQIEDLQDLVDRMATLEDRRSATELDAAFHIALARCSSNTLQVRLVSELQQLIVKNSDVVIVSDNSRLRQAVVEHREIVAAVRARDAEEARRAMRRHLSRATSSLRLSQLADGDGHSSQSKVKDEVHGN